VLPAFMAVACGYGIAHWTNFNPQLAQLPSGTVVNLTAVLGSLGTLLAFALFVCTAMIYASLRFLREWHTPLTVINYTLLGGASGFTLAAALSAGAAPAVTAFLVGWAIILTCLGFIGRIATLIRNCKLKPKSTLQSAIGIKHPRIVQKSQGFMGGAFNTREFFHGRTRLVLRSIKWFFLLAAFAAPLAMLAGSLAAPATVGLAAACAIQYLGLLAERWYFFAQANHPQNLYYQAAS
jgi:DMSO reductase anchor subunit